MKITSAIALLGLLAPHTGCLGDERCDEGQRLEQGRCLPAQAADRGPDQAPADARATDVVGACAFLPTPDQLRGPFEQTGTVDQSDCDVPMPAAGFEVDGEVTFSGEAGAIVAALQIVVDIQGTATIEDDGAVLIRASGTMLDITFSAEERLCFADADSATGRAAISLVNPAGPLCSFELPVALKRKQP